MIAAILGRSNGSSLLFRTSALEVVLSLQKLTKKQSWSLVEFKKLEE